MVQWGNILQKPVGRTAIQKFADGELSCEGVQKVFRASKDRDLSGQIRSLIRNEGTKQARQVAKAALKRRNLL